jgi:dUTP pyrophosphatase
MFKPVFYVEDENFAPQVAHPGDAGADIKAFVEGGFNRADAIRFFREFESNALKYGYRLYINGEQFDSELQPLFLEKIESEGGAVFLPPGETVLVNSGFKIVLPEIQKVYPSPPWNEFVLQYKIVGRSGLCHNHGVVVTNSPGVIDSRYRGWVKVSLTNEIGKGALGDNYHVFTHGARIAQGVCELAIDQTDSEVTTNESVFTKTERSMGGFGSTGV